MFIALEECTQVYTEITAELIQLYEDRKGTVVSSSFLPVDWQQRMSELQADASDIRRQISELEMLFEFVKKLLELNAEVAFLGGAEFVSTQASERLFSLTRWDIFEFGPFSSNMIWRNFADVTEFR